MKAIVYTKYGTPDVLELKEVEKPVPNENEVLVKVHAVSINAADWHLLTADIPLVRVMGPGFLKPKINILGANIAGRIESVGKNVNQFKPGDEIFVDTADGSWGGLAEYACAYERSLVLKPANISFEEAAAVPMAGVTALQGLRDEGKIQPGQKVLINGASGGVGTFAVQLAKYFGAEVTAVCSTRNLEQARSLGAGRVIDYTKEDFTKSGERYDLIFAANGNHSIFDYKRALKPGGRYVMAGGAGIQMFQAMLLGPLISMTSDKKMGGVSAKVSREDLAFLAGLLKEGKIRAVIDRRYTLQEAAEAFRYLGEKHARGKIVITVEHND